MQEFTKNTSENTIDIFVPIEIKKRGNTAMLIIPQNADPKDQQCYFDDKLIKTIGLAYKWKKQMASGEFESLADISRNENVGTSYVSKIYNLNFLSPKIVKQILTGTQPRTLKLQDLTSNRKLPILWQEQEEMFTIK